MTTDTFQLDLQRSKSPLDFLSGIRKAKASGKSLGSLVMEIMRLRRGKGRLQPEEYFMYGLYDDERFTPEAKATFLGQNNLMLESSWTEIARDKPTFSALLRGLDLPIPETQAIVHPSRSFPGAVPLRNGEDIARFLRSEAAYPIFGKPFDSVCSMGTAKITGYDKTDDVVLVGGDKRVPVNALIELIEGLGHAYLFQTLMQPHAEIAELIGPCVSSVRMFVMSDDEGQHLFRAAWKIPASANDADNFWRNGNMLAGVDVETGKVVRTLIRTESGTQPIESHPITNAKFSEMTFPRWQEMRELVLSAAAQIPSCHFQGWDVAMTDRGPVLVELEGDGGNPIMEQLCFDSGLLTDRYLEIVETAKDRERRERSSNRSFGRKELAQSLSALASTRQADGFGTSATEPSNASTPKVSAPIGAPVSAPTSSLPSSDANAV